MAGDSSTIWAGVGYVTSGFSLLAFIIAAIVSVYRINVTSQQRLLADSKGKEREKLIYGIVGIPDIDTRRLDAGQQYQLAMELLNQRRQRLYMQTILWFLFGLFFFLTASFTILKENIPDILKSLGQHRDEKPSPVLPSEAKTVGKKTSGEVPTMVSDTPAPSPKVLAPENTVAKATVSEPATIEEFVARYKASKTPRERKALSLKARKLLETKFNFGSFSYQNIFSNMRHDDAFRFISYDPEENQLRFYLERKTFVVGLAGRPQFYSTDEGFEANVTVNLNDVEQIVTDSVTDKNGFGIDCYPDPDRNCIDFAMIRGNCPVSGQYNLQQCTSPDVGFYIYDAKSSPARKLKNALRTAVILK
ncbi:hypothetical protein [Raoultella planticola]|uniref:hypothetical protein n=2 Tax=Raoultella planticola TaxID=575 RepID=UPI001F535B8C|nr:hypothetical protein [Raoultella planticola]UNK75540.1 hypothetical protein MNO12_02865 [Raoultella planticola]